MPWNNLRKERTLSPCLLSPDGQSSATESYLSVMSVLCYPCSLVATQPSPMPYGPEVVRGN
jgi:hypothetical protein